MDFGFGGGECGFGNISHKYRGAFTRKKDGCFEANAAVRGGCVSISSHGDRKVYIQSAEPAILSTKTDERETSH